MKKDCSKDEKNLYRDTQEEAGHAELVVMRELRADDLDGDGAPVAVTAEEDITHAACAEAFHHLVSAQLPRVAAAPAPETSSPPSK